MKRSDKIEIIDLQFPKPEEKPEEKLEEKLLKDQIIESCMFHNEKFSIEGKWYTAQGMLLKKLKKYNKISHGFCDECAKKIEEKGVNKGYDHLIAEYIK